MYVYICIYIYILLLLVCIIIITIIYIYIYTRILYASMGIYLYTCVAVLVCPEFIAVGIESCNTWKYCLKVLLWSLQMQNTLFRKVPFFLGSISLGRGIRCGILHKQLCCISCRKEHQVTFAFLTFLAVSVLSWLFSPLVILLVLLLMLRPERCHAFAWCSAYGQCADRSFVAGVLPAPGFPDLIDNIWQHWYTLWSRMHYCKLYQSVCLIARKTHG